MKESAKGRFFENMSYTLLPILALGMALNYADFHIRLFMSEVRTDKYLKCANFVSYMPLLGVVQ